MDRLLNAGIALATLGATLRFLWKDGAWCPGNLKKAFRYFTVQSNVFCALASLLLCLPEPPGWAWLLKYIGTAAVTVTMLTVFLFLGPTMGGVGQLLKGGDLFMHLLTPLAALVSFCILERRGMSFAAALTGMLPVALYGTLYLGKVVCAPVESRWEDFYGFNKNGRWALSFAAMLTGCFGICMLLYWIQNSGG